MGKTHRSRSEKDKPPGCRLHASGSDIAPLFLTKISLRTESKMAATRADLEEEAESNRGQSEADSEGEEGIDIPSYIANLPSKSDIKEMLHEVKNRSRRNNKGVSGETSCLTSDI